jgi:hypothetical protein
MVLWKAFTFVINFFLLRLYFGSKSNQNKTKFESICNVFSSFKTVLDHIGYVLNETIFRSLSTLPINSIYLTTHHVSVITNNLFCNVPEKIDVCLMTQVNNSNKR